MVSRETPIEARQLFGDRLPLAVRFVEMLIEHGVTRGLIGPREVDRLWDRHVLNSAVVAEVLPRDCVVIDVGSGAGLPGIPLAIARPDIQMTLLEPMARRVAWLLEVIEELELPVTVVRGRAEEKLTRKNLPLADAVTARAVAPLAKLATWCLPLLRPQGQLVALKGASVAEELQRDAAAVSAAGGGNHQIIHCGATVLAVPTTVALVQKVSARGRVPAKKERR